MESGVSRELYWSLAIICFLAVCGIFFYFSAQRKSEEREEISSGQLTLTSEEQAFVEGNPFRREGEADFCSVCLSRFDPSRRPCLILELLKRHPEIEDVVPLPGHHLESPHTYLLKIKKPPPESSQ
jgi:hypothetical protein